MSKSATYEIDGPCRNNETEIKVGAQHRDTYQVTGGRDGEAGAREVVGCNEETG